MAREISYSHFNSTDTLYAVAYEIGSDGVDTGAIWQIAGQVYETPTGANSDAYDIAMTEDGATQHYSAAAPSNIVAPYLVKVFVKAGGTAAWSDTQVGQGPVGLVPVDAAAVSESTSAADVLQLFAAILDQSTGQLDSGSFAAAAITAAAIATDAIGSAELAASAVTDIQSGLALASVCTEARLAEFDAANLPADIAALNDPSAATIAAAVLAEAYEGSETLGEFLRGIRSILVGKSSGFVASGVSSPAFRDAADAKDRITATVDAAGNRTSVTIADLS